MRMVTPAEIILVALGGACGATLRFLAGRLSELFLAALFPFATLSINIIGCFVIGIVAELSARGDLSADTRLLFATGILGGFTTFSAFGLETVTLLRAGHVGLALCYIATSVIGGCAATYIGINLIAAKS